MGVEIYLGSYLEPLAPFLERADVTDIFINRPGEVWIERLGGKPELVNAPGISRISLERLSRQIAAWNAQGISRQNPLLSGALPDGSRVQIALPPATRGEIAIAIRRHASVGLSLSDYRAAAAHVFDEASKASTESDALDFTTDGDIVEALSRAVGRRKNILIAGGTSTGKTTFLNALLREVPDHERLILIEDTPELQITHGNAVGLLAARGSLGEADVTAEDLLIASLRMRPDRIILGELRGKEALTFLRSVNTGHPGSMTTIHADTPQRALDQLALLVLQAGANMQWNDVLRYVVRSVDIIVQLARRDGRRVIEQVWEPQVPDMGAHAETRSW